MQCARATRAPGQRQHLPQREFGDTRRTRQLCTMRTFSFFKSIGKVSNIMEGVREKWNVYKGALDNAGLRACSRAVDKWFNGNKGNPPTA